MRYVLNAGAIFAFNDTEQWFLAGIPQNPGICEHQQSSAVIIKHMCNTTLAQQAFSLKPHLLLTPKDEDNPPLLLKFGFFLGPTPQWYCLP